MSVLIDMPHSQLNSCNKVSFFVDIPNAHSWYTIATPNIHPFEGWTI